MKHVAQSYNRLSPTSYARPNIQDVAFHKLLLEFNKRRLTPSRPSEFDAYNLANEYETHALEYEWLFEERVRQSAAASGAPTSADDFVAWIEALEHTGPGQQDPLFEFLAEDASLQEMRWFLAQEVSGEAGFDDLVALTQVRLPTAAKLELARNYWDEMGRGNPKGMHGPMLSHLATHLDVSELYDPTVWEALALNNLMTGLACNRTYAYHSVGALGIIELTAPARAKLVSQGLRRLGIGGDVRHYFDLHSTLDVKHSAAWNREVFRTLVADDPSCAALIAEGALMRLYRGKCCFDRYKARLRIGF